MTTENTVSTVADSSNNPTIQQSEPAEYTGRATYSPEDNKLRLYIGRVPRDEYLKLRAAGWTALHKQREAGGGDFVATWTPSRRDTALEYAGIIEDEDMGPAERAADRAERFGDYRDKRTLEATGHADRFDSGPAAHGYQSQARAERAAARHDRIAGHAVDAWGKAEYWQRRTAGVISHALYKSTPGVRMGRIKIIEAELRKERADMVKRLNTYRAWQELAAETDIEKQNKLAKLAADYVHGEFKHPVTGAEMSLYRIAEDPAVTGAQIAALWLADHGEPAQETDWTRHLELRLAYENAMCEAAGGRAALVEMIPGGFIGSHQIRKVVKSPVTGLVVSVEVMGKHTGFTRESDYKQSATRAVQVLLNIERLGADTYRAPTDDELAEFKAAMKAEKDAKPKVIKPPLINPTDADAERLQAMINARALALHEARNTYTSPSARAMHTAQFKPAEVCRITQATYSQNSKGSYSRAETRGICGNGEITDREWSMYSKERTDRAKRIGPKLCELRITGFDPVRVIILTDKPQKPLPAEVWQKFTPPAEQPTPSGAIECSACNRTARRGAWEKASNALFAAAIVCPNCGTYHAATNEAKTAQLIGA